MPIRFRCSHCGQMLSVSRKKAGGEATCPQCVQRIRIPDLPEEAGAGPAPAVGGAAAAPAPEEPAGGGLKVEEELNLRQVEKAAAWASHPNPWKSDEEEEPEMRLGHHTPADSVLDMTPMVDVVMLLLIFFMITASFATQKSLESSPPEMDAEGRSMVAASAEEIRDDSVVVTIDAEDELAVDDVPVAGPLELADVLRGKMQSERKTDLLIEADPSATHGAVVMVMDVGLEVQMQHIRRTIRKSED